MAINVPVMDSSATNTTGLTGNSRLAPYELVRAERFSQLLDKMSFPASYLQNSQREAACLLAVETFRSQFGQLFPGRQPLLLCPLNECGTQKFISSYVRPTTMRTVALYDLDKIAQFVADFVVHEPLEDPALMPARVVSPTTTLSWQVGNSIECALTLCSLLLGAGYDAHVVLGHAAREVAECDRSEQPWDAALPKEVNSDDDVEPEPAREGVFWAAVKRRPTLVSRFDAAGGASHLPPPTHPRTDQIASENKMLAADRASAFGALRAQSAANAGELTNADEAAGISGDVGRADGAHVHAWVAVLGRGRQTTSPLFIEPSTGKQFAATDARYFGVEAVFNQVNYFVNLKPETSLAALSLDLYDLTKWEAIFLCDPVLAADAGDPEPDTKASHKSHSVGSYSGPSGTGASAPDASSIIGGASWIPGDSGDQVLELPASWVGALTISPAQLANRYPGCRKTVQFSDAVVTWFAPYSDPELRVLEVRVPDDAAPQLEQTHTLYAHRHDCLRRRSVYPSTERVAHAATAPRMTREWFAPGRRKDSRVEGLRELIDETGVKRTMRFYWKARDDGLAMREEYFTLGERAPVPLPWKIVEHYRGRESEDRVAYRSATYRRSAAAAVRSGPTVGSLAGAAAAAAAAGLSSGYLHGAGQREEGQSRLPVTLTEKYLPDPAQPPHRSIEKVKFYKPLSAEGEILVLYHHAKDSITRSQRHFPKAAAERDRDATSGALGALNGPGDAVGPVRPGGAGPVGSQSVVVTGAQEDAADEHELREQLRRLITREKECLNEVRGRIEECAEILHQRRRDAEQLRPVLGAYDTLRNRSQETEAEREAQRLEELRRAQSRRDYLAPYIAALDVAKSLGGADPASIRLDLHNARAVRDSALLDLKERLVQRGHIMQTRMDQEKEELNRRQVAFQKNLDASAEGAKESEAFAKYSADATWRMKILDDRLTRHIELASERYAALAQKLAEDPRLAVLYDQPLGRD